jgi:hypothetical protein
MSWEERVDKQRNSSHLGSWSGEICQLVYRVSAPTFVCAPPGERSAVPANAGRHNEDAV